MVAKVRRVPYYRIEPSVFRGRVWKEHLGTKGAVPINTLQTISYARLAPGETPPPPPPKPTAEQLKAQQAEAAHQKSLAEQAKSSSQRSLPNLSPKFLRLKTRTSFPSSIFRMCLVQWTRLVGLSPPRSQGSGSPARSTSITTIPTRFSL